MRPVVHTVDSGSYDQVFIDHAHHEVHDGDSYIWCFADSDLDSTEAVEFIIVSPNTDVEPHFNWAVDFTGPITLTFTAEVTHTPVAPASGKCRNRRNQKTSGVTIDQVTGTFSTGGTNLITAYLGKASTGAARSILNVRETAEWILKKNAKYSLKITSEEDNMRVTALLGWYEMTRKEAY